MIYKSNSVQSFKNLSASSEKLLSVRTDIALLITVFCGDMRRNSQLLLKLQSSLSMGSSKWLKTISDLMVVHYAQKLV
jgi:hypothetical protein